MQIQHAPHLSYKAKLIKLADKICNVKDIGSHPPAKWDLGRKWDYIEWSQKVVAGLRGVNQSLEDLFDQTIADARQKVIS
jgi:guanosine-3',5'-bis(diphosphate) 3'-pyrophosphohydrolase